MLGKRDHCLDDACFGFEPGRERVTHFIEASAVSNPWLSVDAAIFDEVDDSSEIAGQGVAAGHDRHFTPVHEWVAEVKFLLGDADKDKAPGERYVLEGRRHGFVASCRVDDDVGELSGGKFLEGFEF